MNTTILREISFQVSRGHPYWGVSLANEYLSSSSPLRRGFVTRARRTIEERGMGVSQLFEQLAEGRPVRELEPEMRTEIGCRFLQRSRLIPSEEKLNKRLDSRRLTIRRLGDRLKGRSSRSIPATRKQRAPTSNIRAVSR